MDGHGLSARFYAMMKSRSLVFKCAMFREWHDEWLWSWVHYVPLRLEGRDWFEVARSFAVDERGGGEREREGLRGRGGSGLGGFLGGRIWRLGCLGCCWSMNPLPYSPRLFPRGGLLIFRCARVIDDQRELLGFRL